MARELSVAKTTVTSVSQGYRRSRRIEMPEFDAFWNGQAASRDTLAALMREQAQATPAHQPVLEIDASGDCDYQAVAKVLALAKNAGLANIGFVRR